MVQESVTFQHIRQVKLKNKKEVPRSSSIKRRLEVSGGVLLNRAVGTVYREAVAPVDNDG